MLAVHPQPTCPGDAATVELEAPVIALGTVRSHCCVHEGEPKVTSPNIDGRSMTQLFAYWVTIDALGLLKPMPP